MSTRKTSKRKPAARKKPPPKARAPRKRAKRHEPERVAVGGLRTLGDVEPDRPAKPKRAGTQAPMAKKARAVLEQEFERALALKEKLAAEAAIGGKEKGRAAAGQPEKLRSLVASLEGMSRFALQMGLISPAESREIYAGAMSRGLYEGWR